MPTEILTDIGATREQFNGVDTTAVPVKTVSPFNPVVVEMVRKDFTGTTEQSTFDTSKEAIDLGSLADELEVGGQIYVNAFIMVGLFTILDIDAGVVTFDFPWAAAGAKAGYFNIPTRLNWYLALRVSDVTDIDDSYVDIRLTPDNDGVMRAEISGALKHFVNLSYGSEFTGSSEVYKTELQLAKGLILNWAERWQGEEGDFTTRTSFDDSFVAFGGVFQIGDPNNGYFVKYFANTEGEDGSEENLPLWLTLFDRPIYFEGFPFSKTWVSSRELGDPDDFEMVKSYFDTTGTLISTDIYSLGNGFAPAYLLPTKIRVFSNPTAAPSPDIRRSIRIDLRRKSDEKLIIEPLYCIYTPISAQNCNTFYLRWLNPLGDWDYFLFEQKIYEGDKVASLGEYETYFDSIAEVSDFQNFVGKQTNQIARVGCDFVNENIAKGLRGLKSSPKVYWYNEELSKWIGVMIDPASYAYRTSKAEYAKVEFTVNLPRNLNQTA